MKKALERRTRSLDPFIPTPALSREQGSLTVSGRAGTQHEAPALVSVSLTPVCDFPSKQLCYPENTRTPLVQASLSHPESLPGPPVAHELHNSYETGPSLTPKSLTPEPYYPLLHPIPSVCPLTCGSRPPALVPCPTTALLRTCRLAGAFSPTK